MACLLVPAAEAVLTTIITKAVEKKEKNSDAAQSAVPFSRKLKWLSNMLWGGSALLALEHVWHGEITPFFPFLTAASNAADTAAMLREMATVGVSMAVVCTLVWCGMLAVSHIIEKRNPAAADEVK